MKMYPDDWQVRLTTGVVSIVCMAAALMLAPWVVNRFSHLLLFLVVVGIVGNVLGRLVCRLLFRSSSGGPPEKEKKGEKK